MSRAVLPTSRIRRAIGLAGAGLKTIRRKQATEETVRRNASVHLAERLGKLRGLPQKMGQLLSMSDDSDDREVFKPFAESAEPVSLADLMPVLTAEWGKKPSKIYKEIDRVGIAASQGTSS